MMTERPSKDELYELYWRDHRTIRQIADHFDVGRTTVRRWLTAEGIPTRDSWQTPQAFVFTRLSKRTIYELYWGRGMTLAEIRQQFSISHHTCSYVFDRYGVPKDTQGGNTKWERNGELPKKYRWPDGKPPSEVADEDASGGGSMPENPDPSKYLAEPPAYEKAEWLYEHHWGYGLSVQEIGAREGVDPKDIRRAMRQRGVPIRKQAAHYKWEPHNGVPPKYEWPRGSDPTVEDTEPSVKEHGDGLWKVDSIGD